MQFVYAMLQCGGDLRNRPTIPIVTATFTDSGHRPIHGSDTILCKPEAPETYIREPRLFMPAMRPRLGSAGILRYTRPTQSGNVRPSSLKSDTDERKLSIASRDDEIISLSRLPSPVERRQGSIVGDPQLPVPAEFSDPKREQEESEEREAISPLPSSPLPPVRFSTSPTFGGTLSASEAALRSKLRLSNRLCSVPEEQSLRVKENFSVADEDRRRISTSCTSPTSSLHPIDVGEAEKALSKRFQTGSRRLSVGALVGSSIFKMEGSAKAEPKPGTGSRVRHKTIPIINPLVKTPNWPSTTYKKGIRYVLYYVPISTICSVLFSIFTDFTLHTQTIFTGNGNQ